MNSKKLELFFLSIFILFLELLLIRWVGTEVSIFAYLQNAILICCFLGLGMGCIAQPKHFPLSKSFQILAVFTLLLCIPPLRELMLKIAQMLAVFHDFVVWNQVVIESPLDQLAVCCTGIMATFILAALIWKMMVPLGAYLAALINETTSPLTAYSINIFGSLVGIWLFSLLSFFGLPPMVWFAVLAILATPLILRQSEGKKTIALWLTVIVIIPPLGNYFEPARDISWSPYQKLALEDKTEESLEPYVIVNNVGYQQLQNNSLEYLSAKFPELLSADARIHQYDLPGRLAPHASEILIVGSGTGNDVAGALRTTKGNITAVEIDPVIIDFGKKYHPERPYASDRVKVIVDDARAVFMQIDKKFDLIVFGLLDSHSTPTLTNARLDHYVYTIESLSQAAKLLKPDGVMVLIFQSQRPYVTRRLAQTLGAVFNVLPRSVNMLGDERGWGGIAYISGDQKTIARALESDAALKKHLDLYSFTEKQILSEIITPTTDNWPYLYIKSPSVPILFILLGCILIGLWIQCKRSVLKGEKLSKFLSKDSRIFIAMGAGFTLFEVYGVNQAAILFGSTWIVNGIVISAILLMILLANFLLPYLKSAGYAGLNYCVVIFLLLVAVLIGIYNLNLSSFIASSESMKLFISFAIFGGPMLLSGLIFASLFEKTQNKSTALGANMFGALIGGVFQLSTFPFGVNSLLILAAIAYLCAAREVFLLSKIQGTSA